MKPKLLPLLFHQQITLNQIFLEKPEVHIEKTSAGRMNYQITARENDSNQSENKLGKIHSLNISDGEISYQDARKGTHVRLKGLNLKLSDIDWASVKKIPESISFHGEFQAKSFRAGSLIATDLKSNLHSDHGLIQMGSTEVTAFGSPIRGKAQIDLRSPTLKAEIEQSAPHIQLASLPSKFRGQFSGVANANFKFIVLGKDAQEMIQSLNGNISVIGNNIHVIGTDIDQLAGKIRTAQGLGLAQLGSTLFAGASSGNTHVDSSKKTVLKKFVLEWKLVRGVAHAQDVAFSTSKTTVACRGNIDLHTMTYRDFSVATVDPKGCAKEEVGILGSLKHPKPDLGSGGKQFSKTVLGHAGSQAGQVGSKIADFFQGKEQKKNTSDECNLFYSGKVLQHG